MTAHTAHTSHAPTTLLLLRHGETEWNLSGRWQGQAADTPLTDLGREQARIVAGRLRAYPIRAIYSSDLLRAFETAQIVGQRLGLAPIAEPALRESDIGAWTGLTWADITERFPDQVAAMYAGQEVRRGGGERNARRGAPPRRRHRGGRDPRSRPARAPAPTGRRGCRDRPPRRATPAVRRPHRAARRRAG